MATSKIPSTYPNSYIETQWVECSYFNASQLEGSYNTPNIPSGYSFRFIGVSNALQNNELGAKCSGKFLRSENNKIRIVGENFALTDKLNVIVSFLIFKT